MFNDFDQAVRMALEPLTQQGRMELCAYCGVTKHSLADHQCRIGPLDIPGEERDGKARARSYAIS